MSSSDARKQWQLHKTQSAATPADLRIAIAGSMTADPLAPYLGAYLLGRGYKNPDIINGPFGQILQICRDPAAFFPETPDVLVLLWRVEDMFPALLDTPEKLNDGLNELARAVRGLRKNFKGTLIVASPPYPSPATFDATALEQPFGGIALYHKIAESWRALMNDVDRARLIDLGALEGKIGTDAARDARKWALYRQPWSENFWALLGRQLGRLVAAETRSPKKCIVLDADNTLWGGVIGEDGLEGIALGEDFPGSAFLNFQRHLLHLKDKGIMLAVASKNNPEDLFEVFDKHGAMALKRRDIVAFQVHWNSKVESLRAIAKTLNIGLDALVFIDDSGKEIAEVQERLPEVTTLQVPEELAELPGLLAGSDLFDVAEVTEEDKRRTEMIAAETERQSLQETMSEAEFKASLGLEMKVFRAQKQHIARVTQLINKTNQFNLTTRRRTQDEVEALASSPAHKLLGMELKDKYGDYGLVGTAILEKNGEVCTIDTLLMSCRVLGRDAETAFICVLAEEARALGCTVLEGRYLPTAKNAMVKDLYKNHGLTFDAARDAWRVAPAAMQPPPAHMRVVKETGGHV